MDTLAADVLCLHAIHSALDLFAVTPRHSAAMGHPARPVAIVTGCTHGGIGYHLAAKLALAGYRVYGTVRRKGAEEDLAEFGVEIVSLELLQLESILSAVDKVVSREGRVDLLVNNAGVPCLAPTAEVPSEVLRRNFDTNFFGQLAMIKAVAPAMIAQGYGRIVQVGSIWAPLSAPWLGVASASKAALHSAIHTLRLELKPYGITVILAMPGAIRSNVGDRNLEQLRTMPEWRLYEAFDADIDSMADLKQGYGFMRADDYAGVLVHGVLLADVPAATHRYGKAAWLCWFLCWLPLWLRDYAVERAFGLYGRKVSEVKHLSTVGD